MTSDTYQSTSKSRPATTRLWDLLTEPAPAVNESFARRRARFLAAVLLGLIGLRLVSLLIYIPEDPKGMGFLLTLLALFATIYGVSRTRHFRLGALATVWSLLGLNLLLIPLIPTFQRELLLAGTSWTVLPLLLGTVLLPRRQIIPPLVAYAAGMLVLPLLIPALSYAHLVAAFAFFTTAAFLALLVQHQLTQMEWERVANLERERSVLEEHVSTRTRKLATLNDDLLRQIQLHRDLLEAANSLLIQLDIETLLQELAEAAHAVLGYELVVVNMVKNEGEQVHVAAHVGLNTGSAAIPTSARVPMTWDDFLASLEERHRRGRKTFFLPGDGSAGAEATGPWDPQDALIALITLSSNESVGLVSVDRPLDGLRPAPETIQALDLFANLAGIAIQNSHNFAAVQRELAERRRAEAVLTEAHGALQVKTELLNRSNQELHTLLYVISHDLKEPLRAIRSFAQILDRRYADPLHDQGRDYLRRIARAGDRLHALLEDILTLSRVDSALSPAKCIDSREIVDDVLNELATEIGATQATVKVHAPLPQLYVNRSWATRAVQNIVANGLKYTHNGAAPMIDIAPLNEGDFSGLAIMDRGPGVPAGMEETIFELFRRGVTLDTDGTGAGLAIARRIARQNGGEAWYEPRPGGGSIFKITFRNSLPEPFQAEPAGLPPDSGKIREMHG